MEYKRTVIILLGWLCVRIHGDVQSPEVLVENMPGYAVTTAIPLLNSTQCRKEMEEFRDAVDRGVFWSLRMLDASGQPSSGYISGNSFWIGNRDQCKFLNEKRTFGVKEEKVKSMPLYRFPADDFPPFRLNFFGAQIRHNSTMQYRLSMPLEEMLVLGICLPASCTEHEVTTMLRKVFDEKLLLATQLYSMDVEHLKISDLNDDYTWLLDGKMIVVILILVALLCVVITATVYDVRMQLEQVKKETKLLVQEKNNIEKNDDVHEKRDQVQECTAPSEAKTVGQTKQVLLHFSAYSNVKQIFDINTDSNEIRPFHGLRFFGMTWLIFFHITYYGINIMANRVNGYIMASDIAIQFIVNGVLSVDTFFVLSGFLLAHNHLKKQTKAHKVVSFYNSLTNSIDMIVKRYIRIMPAYFVTMLLVIVIFTWLEQFSLMYFSDPMHHVCWKYWWRNMLFINNFYNWDELCLNWSWYLSNDMQFYIFGTIILMLSTSYYYTAITIGVLTIIASTVVHAYAAYSIGYIPALDMQYETLSYLYIKPYMRIPSFIVGMGTALLLSKWNYKLELSKKALATCWSITILVFLALLFCFTNKNLPLIVAVVHESCNRLFWSLGIAWIIIACITGNGGILNTILSFSCWIPLSRVSYCAYLINPVIIIAFAMSMKYPIYIDNPNIITIATGVSVFVYLISIALSVIAERPITSCFQKFSILNKKT